MDHLGGDDARPSPAPLAGRAVAVLALVASLVLAIIAPTVASAAGPAVVPTFTGTVARLMVDNFSSGAAGHDEGALTFVKTDDGVVKLPSSALSDVPGGATVQVDLASRAGVTVGGKGASSGPMTRSEATDPESGADLAGVEVVDVMAPGQVDTGLGAAPAATLAAGAESHQVLVVVVELPGATASTRSAAQIAATVNGGVRDYWSTVTGGRVTFQARPYAGTANGHITTKTRPCERGSVAGSYQFWDEVTKTVGFTPGAGRHLLVYFNTTPDCGGIAGLATMGGSSTGADLSGGGLVWANGYNTVGVIGHELGHNLGLGHSQELRCGGAVDGPSQGCTKIAYNDLSDIMGLSWGNTGFLNAVHLQRLGLLPAADVLDVTSSRRVTLVPLSAGSGVRVARVQYGGATYLVEARAPVGTDSWLGSSYGRTGVLVRKVFDPTGLDPGQAAMFSTRESFLLDGDPTTDDRLIGPTNYRTVLPVGTRVPLDGGQLGVLVESASKAGAVVSLQVGGTELPLVQALTTVSRPRATVLNGPVSRRGSVVQLRSLWSWTVGTPGQGQPQRKSAQQMIPAAQGLGRTSSYAAALRTRSGSWVSATGTVTARYRSESTASFTGGWSASAASKAVGGRERTTRRQGASARTVVTACSIGVVARTAPGRGRFEVYVDGSPRGVVRLAARSSGPRVVWSASLGSCGKHTVSVVRLGSGSRTVSYDGLVALS